jgi:hypothetical protein
MFADPAYKTLRTSITESAEATCDAFATLVILIISCLAANANSAAFVKGVWIFSIKHPFKNDGLVSKE